LVVNLGEGLKTFGVCVRARVREVPVAGRLIKIFKDFCSKQINFRLSYINAKSAR